MTPFDFMENKKEGSGQNVIVNVTVQGSVTSERDLANTIATQIYTNRSRGLLTDKSNQ